MCRVSLSHTVRGTYIVAVKEEEDRAQGMNEGWQEYADISKVLQPAFLSMMDVGT